jgi:hypothetical protein
MAYSKTTWQDEVLAGAERFDIKENDGTPINENVQIVLATEETTVGTPVNADNLNNIENGIYALATGAARTVKGVAGASAGDVDDIVAASDGQVLRRSGTTIGFGQIVAAGLADGSVIAGKIATGGVSATAQLANDIVDDTKVGNRVVMATKRKGGSSTDWYLAGTSTYTIGNVKIQCGSASWAGSPASSGNISISFPESFSYSPLILVTPLDSTNKIITSVDTPNINGFTCYWRTYDDSLFYNLYVFWLAIGPE